MHNRRTVLKGGLGLFAYGLAGSAFGSTSAAYSAPKRLTDLPLKASRPLSPTSFDPKPRIIEGFRVRSWFEGDSFNDGLNIPFHSSENSFPNGQPPEPTETIDVAIVGGGLSGLTTAHLRVQPGRLRAPHQVRRQRARRSHRRSRVHARVGLCHHARRGRRARQHLP